MGYVLRSLLNDVGKQLGDIPNTEKVRTQQQFGQENRQMYGVCSPPSNRRRDTRARQDKTPARTTGEKAKACVCSGQASLVCLAVHNIVTSDTAGDFGSSGSFLYALPASPNKNKKLASRGPRLRSRRSQPHTHTHCCATSSSSPTVIKKTNVTR